jgi:triacylglycerol lipase
LGLNNNDIVTRVPPTWWGYRHGGRECTSIPKVACGMSQSLASEWSIGSGLLDGLRHFRIDHFSDHSIEHYIAHIHAAVERQHTR